MFKFAGVLLLVATLAAPSVFAGSVEITGRAVTKCGIRSACFQGRHYYIETQTQRTRDDAFRYCQALNMELINVDDCQENAFITNLLKSESSCVNKNYWTSASQTGDKDWTWGNGTPVKYTNWKYAEPTYKKDQYCVVYRANYMQWSDEICSKKLYFVCESNNACASDDIVIAY